MVPIMAGRIGTGLITTIIMALTSTGVTGDPMVSCSGITITAGSIGTLAGEGLRAAAPRVAFMGGSTEEAVSPMGAEVSMEEVATEAAADMADEARTT